MPPAAATLTTNVDNNDDSGGGGSGGADSGLSSSLPFPTPLLTDTTPPVKVQKPGVAGVGGVRTTENKLVGGDAIGRLQETKGRTLTAAKKVMDESVHKLQSTVDGIRRAVIGDDRDDAGGDRRVSDALDSLFRAVESEGKAAFEYASDVINETADRAKAAVEKARQQKQRPRPSPSQ